MTQLCVETVEFSHSRALSAARAAIRACPAIARRTYKSADVLAHDLASKLWEYRDQFDAAKGVYGTWATDVCRKRMMDMAESSNTRKAAIMDGRLAVPDTPIVEVDSKLINLESRVKAGRVLDAAIERLAGEFRGATDPEIATGCKAAIFALQDARRKLLSEFLPIRIAHLKFCSTHLVSFPVKEDSL